MKGSYIEMAFTDNQQGFHIHYFDSGAILIMGVV
jgi:hypothetical protein